jgi:RNase P subunit RPR2
MKFIRFINKRKDDFEMESVPIFTCQQCKKIISPKRDLYVKVYEGQSLCIMCRKAGGQQGFTPEEEICLLAEENLQPRR